MNEHFKEQLKKKNSLPAYFLPCCLSIFPRAPERLQNRQSDQNTSAMLTSRCQYFLQLQSMITDLHYVTIVRVRLCNKKRRS